MAELTVAQVYDLASQLPPEEQEVLIRRLLQARSDATAREDPTLGLLVLDLGAWPEHMTLLREDEYGDDDR